VIFSIGQEARGAHFVSHDLTAAAIVWFTQLLLYSWILAPRTAALPAGLQGEGTGAAFDDTGLDSAGLE
jgi:hypothetical protein